MSASQGTLARMWGEEDWVPGTVVLEKWKGGMMVCPQEACSLLVQRGVGDDNSKNRTKLIIANMRRLIKCGREVSEGCISVPSIWLPSMLPEDLGASPVLTCFPGLGCAVTQGHLGSCWRGQVV